MTPPSPAARRWPGPPLPSSSTRPCACRCRCTEPPRRAPAPRSPCRSGLWSAAVTVPVLRSRCSAAATSLPLGLLLRSRDARRPGGLSPSPPCRRLSGTGKFGPARCWRLGLKMLSPLGVTGGESYAALNPPSRLSSRSAPWLRTYVGSWEGAVVRRAADRPGCSSTPSVGVPQAASSRSSAAPEPRSKPAVARATLSATLRTPVVIVSRGPDPVVPGQRPRG